MFTMNDIAAMPHYSMSHLFMDLKLFSMLDRGESAQYREFCYPFPKSEENERNSTQRLFLTKILLIFSHCEWESTIMTTVYLKQHWHLLYYLIVYGMLKDFLVENSGIIEKV